MKTHRRLALAFAAIFASPAFAQHEGHRMPTAPAPPPVDHSAHHGHHAESNDEADAERTSDTEPKTPIPILTDADRAAAFPPVAGHAAHDRGIHSYWLADRFEWQDTDEGSLGWEGLAFIGGDVNRLWLRSEGEAADGDVEFGNVEALFGHAVSPWWDVVSGVRHDVGEGPSRTWVAIGVQGLAPYKFEIEATAYVGSAGRTAATFEAEYDTLLTNRWILQWRGEAVWYGKDDAAVGIGSGLGRIEVGARLRYEITRQFAPYVGIEYERAFGGTADLRRDDDASASDTHFVAGIRFWF